MPRISATSAALALSGLIACTSALGVQRTFVSSHGSDANTATNCGFVNPCRGFTAALTVTDDGGEIIALDAAGYGAVTITKSVSITANPGVYAGISVASGDGVTIATPGVSVSLRGLIINGTGGTNGINMTNGAALFVENCVISNFSGPGIYVVTAAAVRVSDTVVKNNTQGIHIENGASLDVTRSKVLNNFFVGIWANAYPPGTITTASISDSVSVGSGPGAGFQVTDGGTDGATAKMSVTRSTSSQNYWGAFVSRNNTNLNTTVVMTLSNTMVSDNSYGFFNSGGGSILESLGNNAVRQNPFGDTTGTITTVSGI